MTKRIRSNLGNFGYIRRLINEKGIDYLLEKLDEVSDMTVIVGDEIYAYLFRTVRGQRGVCVSFGHPYHLYKYYPRLSFKDPLIAISYMILEDLDPYHSRKLIKVGRNEEKQVFIAQWGTKKERIYIAILNYEIGLWEKRNLNRLLERIRQYQGFFFLRWKNVWNTYSYTCRYFSFQG